MREAAILAGGMGRRIGKPKLFLKYGEGYLYESLGWELKRAVGRVMIVLSEGLSLPVAVHGMEVLCDDDAYAGSGPLGGLYTAMREMKGEHLFVCSVDMPFVTGLLAAYLLDRIERERTETVIPFVSGKAHPLCAAYAKAGSGKIKNALDEGELRVSSLIHRLGNSIVNEDELKEAGIGVESFENINTLDDLIKLEGD
jgi:molybdopterin-guanine dinucleotide biosynthesis protein A